MDAKVADFGLCRCTNAELYNAYQEVGLPVRWLSPEALKKAEFSTASDVWSFGVFAFEVFSCGSVPYSTLAQGQLLDYLESGSRLEQPELCAVDVYV
ncbi:TK/KIN6 protein kinase [Aphelenchoides avenae]|nr:TK/KIN6 protein kinase [Aphelenchus avenae]